MDSFLFGSHRINDPVTANNSTNLQRNAFQEWKNVIKTITIGNLIFHFYQMNYGFAEKFSFDFKGRRQRETEKSYQFLITLYLPIHVVSQFSCSSTQWATKCQFFGLPLVFRVFLSRLLDLFLTFLFVIIYISAKSMFSHTFDGFEGKIKKDSSLFRNVYNGFDDAWFRWSWNSPARLIHNEWMPMPPSDWDSHCRKIHTDMNDKATTRAWGIIFISKFQVSCDEKVKCLSTKFDSFVETFAKEEIGRRKKFGNLNS